MASAAATDPETQETTGTELNPLSGYAWTKKKGYFQLSLDCVEDPDGIKVWHDNSKTWKHVSGEDLDPDDGDTDSYAPSQEWNRYEKENRGDRRDRDGDVPEWDGKAMHRTTYFRKIDLWVRRPQETSTSPLSQAYGRSV